MSDRLDVSNAEALQSSSEIIQGRERSASPSASNSPAPQAGHDSSILSQHAQPAVGHRSVQPDEVHPSPSFFAPFLRRNENALILRLDATEYHAVYAALCSQTIPVDQDFTAEGRAKTELHIARVVEALAAKRLEAKLKRCPDEVEERTTLSRMVQLFRKVAGSLKRAIA